MLRRACPILIVLLLSACAREPPDFVGGHAEAHVRVLAETIGSRPIGTPANARARAYILDHLRQSGYEVRVQEVDAQRRELARTARVANIIGLLPGSRPEAIGLVSHYDSSPYSPGAADSALGVGVALEAARVLAAQPGRQWSLLILLTDGEEAGLMGEDGLMGAAGLITDRAVMDRLHAYVNLDAAGSSGRPVLFEAGPGNGWIVRPWARHAPYPRGGSFAIEISQRLPNDTDFSLLKTRNIPGLNFAAVDDSYPYHTERDTADRLSAETIRTTGENVVAIVNALQAADITQRSTVEATFFDLAGRSAVAYGAGLRPVIAAAALLLGVLAWLRLTAAAIRENGPLRWVLMLLWAWVGAGVSFGAMVGATWLLRTAREVYHPWYARPGRLFVLLIVVGVTAGWSVARLGQWLPRRAHPARHPALTWSLVLPAWMAAAGAAAWFAPAASHLWTLPLLAAGLMLAIVPPSADRAIRLGSVLVLVVAATLWARETWDLLRFMVAVLGRLPLITPVWIYAAGLGAAGLIVVPPLLAVLATPRPGRRPWLVTSALVIACAASTLAAWLAPAYTAEQPLRRHVRALQEAERADAVWEIAGVEPGIDLGPGAPGGWTPVTDSPPASIPRARLNHPFVLRTTGPGLGAAPATVSGFSFRPLPDGVELHVAVVPAEPGLTVSFVLPDSIVPARSSLPGLVRMGRWTATFVAPPPEGIAWQAAFRNVTAARLRGTRIAVSAPGFPAEGSWPHLPPWLPRERAVWSATATWILQPPAGGAPLVDPPIAPVPPLR